MNPFTSPDSPRRAVSTAGAEGPSRSEASHGQVTRKQQPSGLPDVSLAVAMVQMLLLRMTS